MCAAQSLRKIADVDLGPEQSLMMARRFCAIHAKSIRQVGNTIFCLANLSISLCLTLSAIDRILSFSRSDAFNDFASGQKKILIPDGKLGKIQRNLQFHKLETNVVLGLRLRRPQKANESTFLYFELAFLS